ncbi:MAG: hypothetical protein ABI645_01400 [Pseudomonadota bacterium]
MMRRIISCVGLLVAAAPVLSAEVDYALSAGLAHSDNIEQQPAGSERSSTSAVAGLELRGSRPQGRLRYDIATDVSYYDYLSNNLDSELLGRAALQSSYDFIRDSVSWNASLGYDQIRQDILRPLAPGNIEDQLTFSTGPTLRAHFSNVMEAQLDGKYTRLEYGDRPFDNETLSARAQIGRRASPRSLLAIGGSYDAVSFLSGTGSSTLDYDRRELFARVEYEAARTAVALEAGYSDVSGELVDDSGPVFRAQLSRKLTPVLKGYINAVREYPTSAPTPLSADPTVSGAGAIDNSLLTSGPRQATSLDGGLRLERPRTQAEIGYMWRKEDAVVGIGKRDYQEVHTRLIRLFTPRVRGGFYAALTSDDLPATTQTVKELVARVELGVSIGRRLGLDARVERRERDGDISELSGGIFLRYSTFSNQDAMR